MYIYNIYVCKSTYTHIYEEKKCTWVRFSKAEPRWFLIVNMLLIWGPKKKMEIAWVKLPIKKKKSQMAEKTVKVQIA